jgi:hypothetical protein
MRAGEECARREEGEEHLGGRLREQARPHPRPRTGDLQDTGTYHGVPITPPPPPTPFLYTREGR